MKDRTRLGLLPTFRRGNVKNKSMTLHVGYQSSVASIKIDHVVVRRFLGVQWSFASWQHLRSYQSGRLPTCDSQCTLMRWRFYSAAPLGDYAAGTMARFPTQLHCSETELTSPFPILVMPRTRLGSGTYQYCKSLI